MSSVFLTKKKQLFRLDLWLDTRYRRNVISRMSVICVHDWLFDVFQVLRMLFFKVCRDFIRKETASKFTVRFFLSNKLCVFRIMLYVGGSKVSYLGVV